MKTHYADDAEVKRKLSKTYDNIRNYTMNSKLENRKFTKKWL